MGCMCILYIEPRRVLYNLKAILQRFDGGDPCHCTGAIFIHKYIHCGGTRWSWTTLCSQCTLDELDESDEFPSSLDGEQIDWS